MSLVERCLALISAHRELLRAHSGLEDLVRVLQRDLASVHSQLEAAGDVRIRLEDEARERERIVAECVGEVAAARQETIETHRRYADYFAYNMNRRTVFEPHAGPVLETPLPISPGRVHASDVVREMTQKAMEKDTARQAEARKVLAEQVAKHRAQAEAQAAKEARAREEAEKAS